MLNGVAFDISMSTTITTIAIVSSCYGFSNYFCPCCRYYYDDDDDGDDDDDDDDDDGD